MNRIANNSQYNETYAYDARGNRQTLLSDQPALPSAATYAYDVWNRLTQVTTDSGSTVTYRYNGDGLLYERTENGITTRYYYDGDQMIAEASVVSGVPTFKARYVRGTGKRLIEREDANGSKAYYLHNGHGDVTELRDSNGNTLNSYTYDIWGNPLLSTETVSNPFRYSGEYWDQTKGLQYLRARWYDPGQGRFLSEDTFEGDYRSPESLNLYLYVTSNPLRYYDPTGHMNQEAESFNSSSGYSSEEGTSSSSMSAREIMEIEEIAQAEINEAIEAEGSGMLTADELRGIGKSAENGGIRAVQGTAEDALNFFNKQVDQSTVREVKSGVFVGSNAKGITFTYRAASKSGPPTIDINGVDGIRKIKFLLE